MNIDESTTSSSSSSSRPDENDFINGHILSGIFLPREILLSILSILHFKDLESCRLVCRSWRLLIDSVVCYDKLDKHKKSLHNCFAIPSEEIDYENIPFYVYSAISKNGFGRNLLKNVFGAGEDPHVCNRDVVEFVDNEEDQLAIDHFHYPYGMHCVSEDCPKFKHWQILSSGGDGWIVEQTPNGSDPLPEELEERSCFATSYHTCRKRQLIKLADYGLTSKIMDNIKPYIEISDWYAARFDCGCIYKLKVKLIDIEEKCIEEFEKDISINQWEGRKWHKISHTFTNYKKGVRYIVFDHAARDTQFWAGHYGMKMAGASVIARLPPTFFQNTSHNNCDLM